MKISNKIIEEETDNIEIIKLLKNNYVPQLKVIDIEVVQRMLKYKTVRGAVAWCEKNGLFILKQGLSRTVSELEFILIYHKPRINYMKRNHKNWKEMFLNLVSDDMSQLLSSVYEDSSKVITAHYKPKSKGAKDFLSKMNDL